MFVTLLGDVDETTLGIDDGTEMGSLDGSFDVSDDYKFQGLLL